MIEITKNGNIVAEYAYDPEGFRVVKKAKGETTHYVFQGTEPIFEKNITTGKMKSFVYALGKHLARVDGRIGDTGAKKYWYVTDHVGSIRAVTDIKGKKVWSADYLAFGKQFGKDAATDFEELHSFTGKEYDPDTGLHYYNARWYDSELGRFVSEDPVADPNNPNLYSYCRNNPLRFIDPTGLYYEGYVSQSEAMSMHQSRSSSSGGNYGGTSGGNQGGASSSDGSGSSGREAAPGSTKSKDFWGRETETTWDKDGNKVTETYFDKDGNLKGTKYYNPDGTIHSEYCYNKDDGTVSSITTYHGRDSKTKTVYIDKKDRYEEYVHNFTKDPVLGWIPKSSFGKNYDSEGNIVAEVAINWDSVRSGASSVFSGLIKAIGGGIVTWASSGLLAGFAGITALDGVKDISFGFVDITRGFEGEISLKESALRNNPDNNILYNLVVDVVFGI